MFRRIFDAFNFMGSDEESTAAPVDQEGQEQLIDEDGWVNFNHPTESGDSDEFAFIENPEILEMGDETTIEVEMRTTPCPEVEAIKRREEYNLAKAKTAFRNHLESVMFADPDSGKDVRTFKSTHGSGRSVPTASGSIRRLNTQSQRSKKSSGKSNDRKTHRVSDLQLADA
ncbi:PAX3-and PAX7-binding protein 1 [Caenorhabditis elegans]|uniref:PAX3-and PAX7-binding protein 1 n=1 Tax=Caenorhabditis elegans TaxID=6239 RepID=P91833_CAEEL|nr:PAX3-and PAX7-binding protein 1 [Caenorhabditis elegans]CAB03441.1 PAX3-and PAX7-binding protein 1 [Caenorhabditis elegans]|eukprot:NP_492229.1 Uncharacterized protein CELE_T28B8.1 [Caenorhabditis elegans]